MRGEEDEAGVTRATQAATLQLNPASEGTQPVREGGRSGMRGESHHHIIVGMQEGLQDTQRVHRRIVSGPHPPGVAGRGGGSRRGECELCGVPDHQRMHKLVVSTGWGGGGRWDEGEGGRRWGILTPAWACKQHYKTSSAASANSECRLRREGARAGGGACCVGMHTALQDTVHASVNSEYGLFVFGGGGTGSSMDVRLLQLQAPLQPNHSWQAS